MTPEYPLTEGQPVTYTDASGNTTNYTVHVVSGPDSSGNEQIQLMTSSNSVAAITPSPITLPGINIDEQSQGVASPTVTAGNLGAAIFNQITALESLISSHGTDLVAVAGYQAQVTALNLELVSLGLLPSNSNLNIASVPSSDTVIFINVPNIVAQLGVISVEADFFVGTGDLESPGQAEINIINNSPYFLDVNDLTIPTGAGGEITFNGFSVTSNSTINADNKISSYASPPSTTAGFNPFITATNSPPPEITVSSTYDPSFDTVNNFTAASRRISRPRRQTPRHGVRHRHDLEHQRQRHDHLGEHQGEHHRRTGAEWPGELARRGPAGGDDQYLVGSELYSDDGRFPVDRRRPGGPVVGRREYGRQGERSEWR